ncbi:MAG TPA: type II toxin-antitoxin system VapB family antitoxin [Vicinamibacterales bacterium]
MKRTNLVVNEQLLEEAVRLGGERTYSRTVERALEEFVRRIKARRILDLAGTGLWEGNLSVVREDRPAYGTEKKKRRAAR